MVSTIPIRMEEDGMPTVAGRRVATAGLPNEMVEVSVIPKPSTNSSGDGLPCLDHDGRP